MPSYKEKAGFLTLTDRLVFLVFVCYGCNLGVEICINAYFMHH